MPAVTVIIPAYNAEMFIGNALSSIRDQTLKDLEMILVDDGSMDATCKVAQGYERELDLRILKQANAGPAAARNAGIRQAQAQYCAFLDADDLMLPDRLEAQLALFRNDAGLGLVHSDLMTFDDAGIIHRTKRIFSKPCGGMILDRLLMDNFITTSTVMAPTHKLIEAGLFSEERRISEDFDLWLRMAERWKVGFIDRPLVKYRRRAGSLSNDKLVTAKAALNVIEAFWSRNAGYGHIHPRLKRKSLAYHLAVAGGASVNMGRRKSALEYLCKSLIRDPLRLQSWKWLAKTILSRPLVPKVKGSVAIESRHEQQT